MKFEKLSSQTKLVERTLQTNNPERNFLRLCAYANFPKRELPFKDSLEKETKPMFPRASYRTTVSKRTLRGESSQAQVRLLHIPSEGVQMLVSKLTMANGNFQAPERQSPNETY